MNNCCFGFLFFCCLSGVFVFIILGIFTYTNNPFLLVENKDKNDDLLFDEKRKKKAYLQYFIAALFDCLFALLIYILDILLENRNKNRNNQIITKVQTIQEIEIPKKNEIINSVGTQENLINNNENNNENIQNINNEIIQKGMTEKEY